MNAQGINGHPLKTPDTPLDLWLREFGFTMSPAYRCDEPSIAWTDFFAAGHGHHPVIHHNATYLLRTPLMVTTPWLVGTTPVWTGQLAGRNGHLRIVWTANPAKRRSFVLFYQTINVEDQRTPNPPGAMQVLVCAH